MGAADKAFLKIVGETFLERAFKTLSAVCENRVKIVLNRNKNAVREKISYSCIFDDFPERGAAGGIHAALKNCESEFALILAVDLPLVTGEALKKMSGIALASEDFAATVPRQTDGKFQPLCAAYRPKLCLTVLEKMLQTRSSLSVRDFLERLSVNYVDSKKLSDTESLFFNVNTPLDYKNLVG